MRIFPRPTDRLRLGDTPVQVSPFCLGWVDDPDTVLAAFDAGINFFFLPSDYHLALYRHTIEGLRRLVESRPGARDEIVIAVVGYIENPSFFHGTLDELLWAAPHLDRIDVGVAGAVSATSAGRIAQLAAMRRAGTPAMRAIGASCHARTVARESILARAVDVAFVRYNPLHPGARDDLFPALDGGGDVRVFNFASSFGYVDDATWARLDLEPALWRPDLADYYRFALTRPQVDGLLVAPKVPAHVARILRAVEAGPLRAEEEQHMIDLALLGSGRGTLAT